MVYIETGFQIKIVGDQLLRQLVRRKTTAKTRIVCLVMRWCDLDYNIQQVLSLKVLFQIQVIKVQFGFVSKILLGAHKVTVIGGTSAHDCFKKQISAELLGCHLAHFIFKAPVLHGMVLLLIIVASILRRTFRCNST